MDIGLNGGGIAFNNGAVGNCRCCNKCDDPSVDITLSWTDADVTKEYLGETFTNGQTIEMCPDVYTCTDAPPNNGVEFWRLVNNPVKNVKFNNISHYTAVRPLVPSTFTLVDTFHPPQNRSFQLVWGQGNITFNQAVTILMGHSTDFAFTGQSAFKNKYFKKLTSLGATSLKRFNWFTPQPQPTMAFQPLTEKGIGDSYNGTMTTSRGITITWARNTSGAQWGGCFLP